MSWVPPVGEKRITPMVSGRSDWCISRQRSWGVPIPVFYDTATGEPVVTAESVAFVQAIIAEKGSDAWWLLPEAELLPPALVHRAGGLRKGTDTMDVWFDSGSSWAGAVAARGLGFPADLYLEGSDQHRGWRARARAGPSLSAGAVDPKPQTRRQVPVLPPHRRRCTRRGSVQAGAHLGPYRARRARCSHHHLTPIGGPRENRC